MLKIDNVIHLHRVNYACPVERTKQPEPMTLGERIALVVIWMASTAIVFIGIGWGYQELSFVDWSGVAQLFWVKR
jgi:hypothetical protein